MKIVVKRDTPAFILLLNSIGAEREIIGDMKPLERNENGDFVFDLELKMNGQEINFNNFVDSINNGYNTYNSEKDINEILLSVTLDEFEGLNYAIDVNGDCCGDVKWYGHETDMKKLSLKFPDIIFELSGEGEESGDIWNKYFKNGKMQSCYAKVIFDDFDERKLK